MAKGSAFRVNNFEAVGWCTLCVGILGLGLLIAGAVMAGIAYTELRPPAADENYERYLGSNLMRIVGPIMLAIGALLLIGGCAFFGIAFYSASKDMSSSASTGNQSFSYSTRAVETGIKS